MKPLIIAEIGTNHFGSLKEAKALILEAKRCGATLVKSQAFRWQDVVENGSMSEEFYQQTELKIDEYLELISYGKSVGIDVFYSIFSDYIREPIEREQKFHKVSASQSKIMAELPIDSSNVFVSIHNTEYAPKFRYAMPMYASGYLAHQPQTYMIGELSNELGVPLGYSDHTEGIMKCVHAWYNYQCPVIEKHFTLQKRMSFKGQVFRDTIHGADPWQFQTMVKLIRGVQ